MHENQANLQNWLSPQTLISKNKNIRSKRQDNF